MQNCAVFGFVFALNETCLPLFSITYWLCSYCFCAFSHASGCKVRWPIRGLPSSFVALGRACYFPVIFRCAWPLSPSLGAARTVRRKSRFDHHDRLPQAGGLVKRKVPATKWQARSPHRPILSICSSFTRSPDYPITRYLHSCRSATMGSTWVARRAGI